MLVNHDQKNYVPSFGAGRLDFETPDEGLEVAIELEKMVSEVANPMAVLVEIDRVLDQATKLQ